MDKYPAPPSAPSSPKKKKKKKKKGSKGWKRSTPEYTTKILQKSCDMGAKKLNAANRKKPHNQRRGKYTAFMENCGGTKIGMYSKRRYPKQPKNLRGRSLVRNG